MIRDRLSAYFSGVAWKRLSAVETDPNTSHQHELNGVSSLRRIFGEGRRKFTTRFLYLGEDGEEPVSEDGTVTWYDAREQHVSRTEYRLYYSPNDVMSVAGKDDLIVIAQRKVSDKPDEQEVAIIVARQGSSSERQLSWLFLTGDDGARKFESRTIDELPDRELGIAAQAILEQLGIVVDFADAEYLDQLIEAFGEEDFPNTRALSDFTRQSFRLSSLPDPDGAVLGWIKHEQVLFETLEKHFFSERIQKGFQDVDEFLSFSLSLHNRRKARAGLALEHHLEFVFQEHQLLYSRGAVTENKSKPDFLFPGINQYRDEHFPDHGLTMLGVKSTCKDRWRQVLVEAERIKDKHLFTLESSISPNQTNQMQVHGLQLVVPSMLFETFTSEQQAWLLPLQGFIQILQERQQAL